MFYFPFNGKLQKNKIALVVDGLKTHLEKYKMIFESGGPI